MDKETYWVALGRKVGGGCYAQSLIHLPYWRDSAMQDDGVVMLIKMVVDTDTGDVSSTVIKRL